MTTTGQGRKGLDAVNVKNPVAAPAASDTVIGGPA